MINKLTGEILTEEEAEQNKALAKKEINALIDADLVDALERFSIAEKQIEMWKVTNRAKIVEIMKHNGVQTIDTGDVVFTYVSEHKQKQLDTTAIKEREPEIYEKYLKTSDIKESLRVKFKEFDNAK